MTEVTTMERHQQQLQEIVKNTKRIDQKKMEIVKKTLPIIAQHGELIAKHFYQRMFKNHPELKNIFNQTHQITGHQPKALADAVYAAAAHLADMTDIISAIERIGQKHRSLQIKPEQYPIVGENLLGAIKEILGDGATDEIMDAWADAYSAIADVFIRMENDLYKSTESEPGGWNGFRNFVVDMKVKESDVITSFYLKPQDGQPIADYLPGQYLTLQLDISGQPYTHLRQYSLSDQPGTGYYRISVKREDSTAPEIPAGIVSTYLHSSMTEGDIIPIAAPAGDFYLDTESTNPVVLVAGGVGLTPLISMLNTISSKQSNRKIYFVQAALNSKVHAFKEHVRQVAEKNPNVESFVIYEKPTDADVEARNFDKQGFITFDWMQENLDIDTSTTDFYFCGPTPFMKAVNAALKQWRVSEDKIHYEFFGAFGQLDAGI